MNNGVPSSSATDDDVVRRHQVDFERRLEEEQGVKLARVPDDSLPGDRAEQCQGDQLPVAPVAQALLQRLCRRLPRVLERAKER